LKKIATDTSTKEARFSILFDKHYKRLYRYTYKTLDNESIAEEIVQETFIKLWENFDTIKQSERSIESFLIVTLKNKIIDDYRKNKTRQKHNDLYKLKVSIETEIDKEWELLQQIDIIYTTLEEKTLEIFKLSRDQGLTYKEISKKNNISVKTVELHISKALTAFRVGLKEYL